MADKKATLILQLKDLTQKGIKGIKTGFGKIEEKARGLKIIFAGMVTAMGLFGKSAVSAAADMEQWRISFTTMLGSADRAEVLLNKIKKFAKETPFELPQVVTGAKNLLAFGIEADKVIPTLKSMGDVSSGLGVDMERLILNFGQVKTQTKLTGVELKDFLRAGVPLLAELAKNLGISEAAVKDYVSAGKIGFDDVNRAFQTMSGEGGKFANLMSEQMESTRGKFSNLQDTIFQLKATVGEVLIDFINPAFEFWAEQLTRVKELVDSLTESEEEALMGREITIETLEKERQQWLNLLQGRVLVNNKTAILNAEEKKRIAEKVILLTKALKRERGLLDKERKAKIKDKEDVIKVEEETTKKQGFFAELLHKKREEINKDRIKNFESTLNTISTLSTAKNKALATIGKAAGISQATIDTFAAANRALASAPPPFNFALAGLVTAAGLANVARISGVALAEGGVVLPQRGGVQATIAEAGKAEAVIPLDDEEAQEKLEAIGGTTININAGTIVADDVTMREFAEKIDEELFQLQKNRQTVSI